eukprot:XP_004934983.1 protein Mdm4 isoform X3 [Gallus gallus]
MHLAAAGRELSQALAECSQLLPGAEAQGGLGAGKFKAGLFHKQLITATMTSSSSAQHPAAENACRITLGQANQVRPKLPLLKILQAAGAQGETFTLKEVMHYLGQYIMVRQLYDKRQQHMVYCGGDQLGELLGLESFSVKDPSPVYEMLKRNLTSAAMTDAAQNLAKEQSVDKPSQDQLKFSPKEGSDTVIMGDESNASAVSTSEHKCENYEDKDLIENLSKSKKPKLDLVFEEWDVAGLPWWFLGNLRSNYKSRSNGSTDIQTNQDIDTAIVSDTTDDLWFLNESPLDQTNTAVKMETADCEEVKEGDKKVTEDACLHDFEDSQCLSDDTDTEAASEVPDERGDPVLLYALHSREALPEKERWHLSSGSLRCVQVARCFHQAEVGKEAAAEHLCPSCRAQQAEQILPFLTKCIGAGWNCSPQSSA